MLRGLVLIAGLALPIFAQAEDVPAPPPPAPTQPAKKEEPAKKDATAKPDALKKDDAAAKNDPAKPEKKDEGEEHVVTVTAAPIQPVIEKQGASINRLTAADLEAGQYPEASDALKVLPGTNITQSGRRGTITSLSVRGGNNNQTEFELDGFKVNRQGGGMDLDGLDTIALDHIDLERGPASALQGTGAVNGTFSAVTAKGQGDLKLETSAAVGTYGVNTETMQLSGSKGKFSYNVGGTQYFRDGATENNSDVQIVNAAGRLQYDFNADNSLALIGHAKTLDRGFYESASLATQLGTADVSTAPNDRTRNVEYLVGLDYKGRWFNFWETEAKFGFYHYRREFEFNTPQPPEDFLLNNPFTGQRSANTDQTDKRWSEEWRNTFTTLDTCNIKNYVIAGLYAEQESFVQNDTVLFSNVDVHHSNTAGYAEDHLELFNRAFLSAGVRSENNGTFGNLTTGRGNASILIPESHSRIFGSVGNAYRAPSFFELYAPLIGNKLLQPEHNFAYDVGFEQKFWKDRIVVSATWFHNQYRDFITQSSAPPFSSTQFDEAMTRGFELQGEVNPLKQLTFVANATLMSTKDDQSVRLMRRPGDVWTARVIARPLVDLVPKRFDGLELYTDVQHYSPETDLGPGATFPLNPFDVIRATRHPYTLVNVAASYRFLTHFKAFVRVENATDKKYESIKTFPADGSNTIGGLDFTWKF